VVSHLGQVVSGGETWFARSLATLADDLRTCRPTVFFAVPRVWEKFRAAVEDDLAGSPRPVKSWRVLPHELTVAGGELTPTLKVRRAIVTDRYRDLIDQAYAGV
jgi:long-chain acyl-CoA synthetase